VVMLRLISTEDLYTVARIGYHIVSNKHIKEKEYKYYSLRINERSEIIISFGKMDTVFFRAYFANTHNYYKREKLHQIFNELVIRSIGSNIGIDCIPKWRLNPSYAIIISDPEAWKKYESIKKYNQIDEQRFIGKEILSNILSELKSF